ncbi:MAG: M20/M25/M40 family metallo-hydrolase [Deltaproteobacteria bacterium]|nr:M20/M25/M40 family metallo-hydrolase [Deltaproteobacteria bacterium]
MINQNRLSTLFKTLVEINSESTNEKAVAEKIVVLSKALGGTAVFDDSAVKTGSNTGNLVINFKGNTASPPLLLSAHMDTVQPGKGINVIFEDGRFKSDGKTILGADDKSAIAIILEAITVIAENNLPCCPIELVLTTCEEVGLKGAKNLDFSLITAKYGYVFDTSDTDIIVTRAPAANRLKFQVFGKSAHAGVAPESGVNAISIAAKAISNIDSGRIDHETTCNIGTIQGGVATNIVPDYVEVHGEVRSHSNKKLDQVTEKMVKAFQETVNACKKDASGNSFPELEVSVENDFPLTRIPEDHPVTRTVLQASQNLGRTMELKSSGGGADANIFFKKGIHTIVLGTGMENMHTVRESILLSDMVMSVELLIEIIKLHALKKPEETKGN